MRYLIIIYVKKPSGEMDEMMTVARKLRLRDLQTASVILDFKKLEVVKASLGGEVVERNWNAIVQFYHQFYEATIERLFYENGWEVVKETPEAEESTSESTETVQSE